jgi:hypothetical protein
MYRTESILVPFHESEPPVPVPSSVKVTESTVAFTFPRTRVVCPVDPDEAALNVNSASVQKLNVDALTVTL